MESAQGYYRMPAVHGSTVVFVSEDDLWLLDLERPGIAPQRLTTNACSSHPRISPDGQHLAFSCDASGAKEIFVMPLAGGPARRLTHLGARSVVVGWTPDSHHVLFSSTARQVLFNRSVIFSVHARDGGAPVDMQLGPAAHLVCRAAPEEGRAAGWRMLLGRHTEDAHVGEWKRYQGGRRGEVWLDAEGTGTFTKVVPRGEGVWHVAAPMWIGERVFFVADPHRGAGAAPHGNVFSMLQDGSDVQQHTAHTEYYPRNADTDGRTIVYQCGGDLFAMQLGDSGLPLPAQRIHFPWRSSCPQREPKYVSPGDNLEEWVLHPKVRRRGPCGRRCWLTRVCARTQGHSLAIIARGRPFAMGLFDGPAVSCGRAHGVRCGAATALLSRWRDGCLHAPQVSSRGVYARWPIGDCVR